MVNVLYNHAAYGKKLVQPKSAIVVGWPTFIVRNIGRSKCFYEIHGYFQGIYIIQ